MKTKETSMKEQMMAWWNGLTIENKILEVKNYIDQTVDETFVNLIDEMDIEMIWDHKNLQLANEWIANHALAARTRMANKHIEERSGVFGGLNLTDEEVLTIYYNEVMFPEEKLNVRIHPTDVAKRISDGKIFTVIFIDKTVGFKKSVEYLATKYPDIPVEDYIDAYDAAYGDQYIIINGTKSDSLDRIEPIKKAEQAKKQFTAFDPELFVKYLQKFSKEDQRKAFAVLFDELNKD